MQFSTAVIALASAISVQAAPAVSARSVIFKVSDFTASCIPHSGQCSYDFTVIKPGTMETTGVDCSKMLTSDGTLPAVTDGTCEDSSRTWTVEKTSDGGLTLTVSQPVTPSSDEVGSYTIPASDLVVSQTGASSQQSYTGPAAFDLSY